MDMDAGDCSTDGTCEDMDGGIEPKVPLDGVKLSNLTLWEETTLALQQFSIVVGVALMVGVLFFTMVAVDKFLDYLNEQWSKFNGREHEGDPEDPAALVGSFKRYKN